MLVILECGIWQSKGSAENILLNQAMSIPINETDDHLTHLIINDGALDTVAKALHMQAHLDAYTRIQASQPEIDP